MLVPAKQAASFVNSHAPIHADIVEDRTFVIHFEEVDMDTGKVSWASEAIAIKDGRVDLKKVRDILGY
jgi:hypothetical protein